ncbi:MAG: ROK family protein [Candidatus Latescibacteria bacterium]|nr:ROK family protein [Candidatus Latescibacterota bacterium]
MDTTILVFDIGGTALRAGVYRTEDERLVCANTRPTPSAWGEAQRTPEEVRARLFTMMEEMGRELLDGATPAAVAVAFPGPIDESGRVLGAPTVWGEADQSSFPLREALQAVWPADTVEVLNDVTAAGYYYRCGDGEDLCVITVSSGIGHKVFIHGRPAIGEKGRGGEIGHLRVDFSEGAPRCECGGWGHLGAIASGRGTLLEARRLAAADPSAFRLSRVHAAVEGNPTAIDNELLAEAYRDADSWASTVVECGTRYLGQAMAAIHVAVGVERFVVFGGFALALGERYRRALVRAAAASCWDLGQSWDDMIELGDQEVEAGLIGAGRFAVQRLRG